MVGAAAGAVCERVLLRPLRGQSIDTVMLVMIGLWIAMQNAELLGWGGVAKSVPHPVPHRAAGAGAGVGGPAAGLRVRGVARR